MKILTRMFIGFIAATFLSFNEKSPEIDYQVVPLPQKISISQDSPFILNSSTVIYYPERDDLQQNNARFLSDYLMELTGWKIKTETYQASKMPEEGIVLSLNKSVNQKEGYVLRVTKKNISIEGQTGNGVFYGIQTLRKSIPVSLQVNTIELPAVYIEDSPRFGYRGMMLDVARHFSSVEFVKEFIDLLALHNMNTFHWHLTDDQGWRIEIKKYPRLTDIGSKRSETVVGRNTGKYDNTPHGGFYTQEEIKEVVNYAKKRYITVIPEVDLPGHMLAALAAYPELGCTGGPYEVSKRWGIFPDVLCIGNEKTMQFLEDVMTEVIELFPAEYIHIGGDEAPRSRWGKCSKCQTRIKTENLKANDSHTAEDQLQSYCMTRIEKFLNSKGRHIIGWDEILEGDVAPNATVMSWRGVKGGIAAAKMGHNVIMAPNSYLYFDYYQNSCFEDEPLANGGGCTTIKQTYNYEPLYRLDESAQKYIIGVQANLWTEYIPTQDQAEYMILPRMGALAEVQWTLPEKKDYASFIHRQKSMIDLYKYKGYRFATHIFNTDITTTADARHNRIKVEVYNPQEKNTFYTLDGTTPTQQSTKYNTPIYVDKDTELRVMTINEKGKKKELVKRLSISKSTACPIMSLNDPHHRYYFKGAVTLTDGEKGLEDYMNGEWIAFYNCDLHAIIKLKKTEFIDSLSLNALLKLKSGHMDIKKISVAVSNDSTNFQNVATLSYPEEIEQEGQFIKPYHITFPSIKASYVKVDVEVRPLFSKDNPLERRPAYLFVDEISIY